MNFVLCEVVMVCDGVLYSVVMIFWCLCYVCVVLSPCIVLSLVCEVRMLPVLC